MRPSCTPLWTIILPLAISRCQVQYSEVASIFLLFHTVARGEELPSWVLTVSHYHSQGPSQVNTLDWSSFLPLRRSSASIKYLHAVKMRHGPETLAEHFSIWIFCSKISSWSFWEPFRALEVAAEEVRGVEKVSRMKRLWLQFEIFRSEQMDRAGYWQYTNMGQKAGIVFFPFSVLIFRIKNDWNKLTFSAYQPMFIVEILVYKTQRQGRWT